MASDWLRGCLRLIGRLIGWQMHGDGLHSFSPGRLITLSEALQCQLCTPGYFIRQSIPPQLFTVSINPAGSLPFAQSMSL